MQKQILFSAIVALALGHETFDPVADYVSSTDCFYYDAASSSWSDNNGTP